MRVFIFISFFIFGLLSGCGPTGQTPVQGQSSDQDTDSKPDPKEVDQGTTAAEVPNVPFAMFGGGPKRRHRAEVPGPATEPAILKTFRTGARIFASPVIGPDGTVYVGSMDGTFNAIKKDGTLRWSYVCDQPIFASAAVSKSGIVYIGCDDDTLLAFTTDGNLRFTYRMKQDMDSSPAISEEGMIYTGGDGLHAITSGGVRKWKAILNGHVNSAPSVRSDKVIVVGSHDNRLYAFYPDGTANWVFSAKDIIQGSPAILQNDDVVFGSEDGFVYRLSVYGGMKWSFDCGAPVQGGIAVSKDSESVFVGTMSGEVIALDAKTGKKKWRIQTSGPIRATPTLDSENRLFIGSRDGRLYAVDANIGEILWSLNLQSQIDSTVAITSGKILVVGTDEGVVYFLGEKE